MLPWFQYTVVHIGPIPIQVWGFFVALGMLVTFGVLWFRYRGKEREMVLDIALWMVVSGFLGARLFHILFYEPRYYLSYLGDIFAVWHGGASSFGGIVGAGIGFFLFVYLKKIPKSSWISFADSISSAALFGWLVGRVGCVMIHDHLSGPCSGCFLSMKMSDGTTRLDMALLEIIGLLPLAILFFIVRKKILRPGWYTSALFIYYGIIRFVLDFWRATDIVGADVRYLGLTPAQYFAIILVLMGIVLYQKYKRVS